MVLEELVVKHFDESPFTVKLDRLDDGWDATDDSKMLLAGVLKAARDLNSKLRRTGKPPAVLTFLRSDIFNELRFNDKNKMSADIEHLEWTDDKLLEVAALRIARSLKVSAPKAWETVFSTANMRQRARISSYILKRTMGRPRDMIAFCLKCQEVAVDGGHRVVETQDVYDAEVFYSKHIYDELDDEMHKQVPANRTLLQALKTLGKTRFTLDQWIEVLRKREPAITADAARERLKVLFDYSIVGVTRVGGIQRGTTFQFNYNNRLVEPDFTAEMTVHPALKKELQLAEVQKQSDDESDDD